jgi:hypothetical protein
LDVALAKSYRVYYREGNGGFFKGCGVTKKGGTIDPLDNMHTNAHHLYRSQSIQHRTTTTTSQSLPFFPELLVILIKMNEQNLLLLQCIFLKSCSTLKENQKQSLDPHMLIPWRDC